MLKKLSITFLNNPRKKNNKTEKKIEPNNLRPVKTHWNAAKELRGKFKPRKV